ncbi:MAG TPA: GDSL-type esterase/lipase family protein [Candidatus Acidoferrum sp.]|nr:GDSL-type esterase/lipase family protein [Candidatus Acidoferrum sp.]
MKRGFRVLAFAAAAALALFAVPASAGDHGASSYLALGDSYAFAFNPLVFAAGGATDPRNFPGYTDVVGRALDLTLTNAACPGETSGSFISGSLPDNGCQAYRSGYPLHTAYLGSQLAYAVKFLKSHDHVDLVTVQIGGNDVLTLQALCNGDPTCIVTGLPAVEAQMAANLTTIYSSIRSLAHYRHTIVAVSYFAFNYNDANNLAIVTSLDAVEAAVALRFHVRVANVLGAFALASAPSGIPCLAGLQVQLPTGGCDIHPSAAGHAVYARAVLAALPHQKTD